LNAKALSLPVYIKTGKLCRRSACLKPLGRRFYDSLLDNLSAEVSFVEIFSENCLMHELQLA